MSVFSEQMEDDLCVLVRVRAHSPVGLVRDMSPPNQLATHHCPLGLLCGGASLYGGAPSCSANLDIQVVCRPVGSSPQGYNRRLVDTTRRWHTTRRYTLSSQPAYSYPRRGEVMFHLPLRGFSLLFMVPRTSTRRYEQLHIHTELGGTSSPSLFITHAHGWCAQSRSVVRSQWQHPRLPCPGNRLEALSHLSCVCPRAAFHSEQRYLLLLLTYPPHHLRQVK